MSARDGLMIKANHSPVRGETLGTSGSNSCVQRARREEGMEVVGEEEKAALFSMLKGMLAFRPSERLTAVQVAKTEWMMKWGLTELEKM